MAGIALVLIGFNFGVSWPAFNALIAAVVSGELRQQYFGINFALVNLGIGVGGIVGGIFADVDRPGTFTAIFVGDADLRAGPDGAAARAPAPRARSRPGARGRQRRAGRQLPLDPAPAGRPVVDAR